MIIITTILFWAFCLLGVFGILAGVIVILIERPGKKHCGLHAIGAGALLIAGGVWIEEREERTADAFLNAWQAASADYPGGRMNTPDLFEFMDLSRFPPLNPYLAQHMRLLKKTPAAPAGKDFSAPVSAKVFLSDVRMRRSEGASDFVARMRIWVATDNNLVARLEIEDIAPD